MRFGFRVPSIKKRVSARTSVKRLARHNLGIKAPKGMGIITNPKKALYNAAYSRTTIPLLPSSKRSSKHFQNDFGSNLSICIGMFFGWIVLIPIGSILTASGIGAILGLPLIICGLILPFKVAMAQSKKSHLSKQASTMQSIAPAQQSAYTEFTKLKFVYSQLASVLSAPLVQIPTVLVAQADAKRKEEFTTPKYKI